jgi:ATP-dependent DNA helicase RecG
MATESDRIEWKESPEDSEGILKGACALANDLGDSKQPGFLVLGLDKRGRLLGVGALGQLDEMQQKLSSRLSSTKIAPTPTLDIGVHEIQGKHLIIVTVHPYPVPPVVTLDGSAWVRVGTTTRRATEADLARLRERRPEHKQPFDTRPCYGASLQDIDQDILRKVYEIGKEEKGEPETFPSFESWLTLKQLGRPIKDRWVPTIACVLVHGICPQSFLPGAKIEFVRYGGADVDAPVTARKTLTSDLPSQLESLWTQLSAHNASVPIAGQGIAAPYAPLYPLEALKELARNLVQHRQYEGTNAPGRVEWYDDRIEFYNPGAPFGRASEGEFGSHADYRNPLITSLLVQSGYVEQLGRGIRRVGLLLERNGNPPLRHETNGYTRVTVRRKP